MFATVFRYITDIYQWVFVWLDQIRLIGSFSLLDFCFIIIILGMIIPVVVASLKYSAVRGMSTGRPRARKGESKDDEE